MDEVFLGRAKTPDIPDPADPTKTIPGPDRVFLEGDKDSIIRDLESGNTTTYFLIKLNQNNTILVPVKLKTGQRVPGRLLDIAELEADGVVVGSAEVER